MGSCQGNPVNCRNSNDCCGEDFSREDVSGDDVSAGDVSGDAISGDDIIFTDNFMYNLLNFIGVLRKSGIAAGLQEILDVFKILADIDIRDRLSVKFSLSGCLAKTRQERQIFNEAFEIYFTDSESRSNYVEQRIIESGDIIDKIDNDSKELQFQGVPLEIPWNLKEVYSKTGESEKEGIREFLRRTSEGKKVGREFMPLVENMIRNRLKSSKTQTELQEVSYIPSDLWNEAGVISYEIAEKLRQQNSLVYKNLSGIKDEEVPQMVQLIKKMSMLLRIRLGKKYKKSSKKLKLDIRKTLRFNFSTGDVLFRLKYKKKSPKKKKYILFSDVSGSMYRYSSFVIQFVLEMQKTLASLHCSIFSEECEHIDFKAGSTCAELEDRIKASPIWRKGTDIGSSLGCLLRNKPSLAGSSAIFIIVSDAKTINANLAKSMLSELSKKVRKIIWLNPLPEDTWGAIPEINFYRKYCEMLDCSTLERLAKACAKI